MPLVPVVDRVPPANQRPLTSYLRSYIVTYNEGVHPMRQQSRFVAEALKKELRRVCLAKAIETSFGAWKETDHPELARGAETFVLAPG